MIILKNLFSKLFFYLALTIPINIAEAQICGGSWALQRPLTSQCVVGQWIGWQNMTEPEGCPINPIYTGVQINTFTFDNAVNSFSIDFKGFDGNPQCARMEVRINGIFYPLTAANLFDFMAGSTCTTGSFSYIALTPDGYITNSIMGGQGHTALGRIIISNVNATSVTLCTNDGFGTTFSDPFDCISVVPLKLLKFTGNNTGDCRIILNWKTGAEFNIRNIEIEDSEDGTIFKKIGNLNATGSNSQYSFKTAISPNAYFRLKFNDLDGNYEYSEILSLKSKCSTIPYQVSPNPTSSSIQLSGLKNDDRLLVLDMRGRTLLTFNSPRLNNKFDIQNLLPGMYILQVINSGLIKANIKVIKN